jgi:hypothetical protein
MTLLRRLVAWGVDHDASTRSAALLRIGLPLVVWSRFGLHLQLYNDLDPRDVAFGAFFFATTAAMAVGWKARLSTAGTAVALGLIYFFYGHGEGRLDWTAHHVYLLVVATAFLALTPAGRSLSVDRWRALRRAERGGPPAPPERGNLLGLRLIGVQLVAIYLWAAVHKLTPGFLSGERMQHFVYHFYAGIDWGDVPGFAAACLVAAWLTVYLELLLASGLLVPRFQRVLVPLGVAFHALIYLTLPVLTFSSTMILLYLAVLDPDAVHRLTARLLGGPRPDADATASPAPEAGGGGRGGR